MNNFIISDGAWEKYNINLQKIQNQQYLSVEFFEQFEKIFGFGFHETEKKQKSRPDINYILPGVLDKKYIAMLIKNAKKSTWKNIAKPYKKHNLSSDLKDFEKSFYEILRYFYDENFNQNNFSEENLEIKNYIANKFPKSEMVSENTNKKIGKIIITPTIQKFFNKK